MKNVLKILLASLLLSSTHAMAAAIEINEHDQYTLIKSDRLSDEEIRLKRIPAPIQCLKEQSTPECTTVYGPMEAAFKVCYAVSTVVDVTGKIYNVHSGFAADFSDDIEAPLAELSAKFKRHSYMSDVADAYPACK